jgi:hypothetical protein
MVLVLTVRNLLEFVLLGWALWALYRLTPARGEPVSADRNQHFTNHHL